MGWTNDVEWPSSDGDVTEFSGSTRKVVHSECRTEEVEPGKFIRKCEKTEQTLRDCVGRPPKLVELHHEFTSEDVTDQMTKASAPSESAVREPFPGLRSDVESMERHFVGSIDKLFQGMVNEFFDSVENVFGGNGPSPHNNRGIPIEAQPPREAFDDHFSGKATDI